MRRLLSNKRGQIRVIEAFFASLLMLSSLAIIPAIQDNTVDSEGVLSSEAFNVLESLDSGGQLGNLTDQRNWTAMKNLLKSAISPALWFNLTIFDENGEILNDIMVSSGSAIGNHIETADYICAGTNATYTVYRMRLQLGGLN